MTDQRDQRARSRPQKVACTPVRHQTRHRRPRHFFPNTAPYPYAYGRTPPPRHEGCQCGFL